MRASVREVFARSGVRAADVLRGASFAAETDAKAAAGAGDPQGPYIVADAETGAVLEHFDALRPWYPASTTKLMTIYVVFRAILAGEITLDAEIIYSANAAAQPPSKMGFKPGTMLTLDNALKMMMVKSANDIAVAVAETVGGSVPGFAERMNLEAARLGMTRSHFVNPHGLPDERQVYHGARHGAARPRAPARFPAAPALLQPPRHPVRREDAEELQPAARALSRRDRHEDRLHLRLGLQSRRLRAARRARGDRRRVRRIRRRRRAPSMPRRCSKPVSGRPRRRRRRPWRPSPRARPTRAARHAPLRLRRQARGGCLRSQRGAAARMRKRSRYPGAADLSRAPVKVAVKVAGRIRRARLCRAHAASPARQRRRTNRRRGSRFAPVDEPSTDSAPAAAIGAAAGSAIPLRQSSRNRIGDSAALLDLEASVSPSLPLAEQPVALLAAEMRTSIAASGSVASTRKRVPAGCGCMRFAAFSTGSGHFNPRTSITTASSMPPPFRSGPRVRPTRMLRSHEKRQ